MVAINSKLKRFALLAFVCISSSAAAMEFQSPKAAMLMAIDSPEGRVSGVLTGPVAKQFAVTTGSSDPVMIEVTTLKRFREDGCNRLNVRLKQSNVPTKDSGRTDFFIDYGINLCRDGSPPIDGLK